MHFLVKSYLFLLFSFLLFINLSIGQNPREKWADTFTVTKNFEDIDSLFKDTAFLKQIRKIYGDSMFIYLDSLSKDTAFIKSIERYVYTDQHGEFASAQYRIQFPILPLGWTSDYENIFSSNQILELDSIIRVFEKETKIEIAILTIDSSWTSAEKFNDFTLAIANKWGVGKKDVNNGILIGISTVFRKIRINNGYGIEALMTDAEAKKIIDDFIIPEFKKGNFFSGTRAGVLAIIQKLKEP